MSLKQGLQILEFPDAAAWDRWLEGNHDTSPGVWLRFAKKGSVHKTVTFAEALEEALRYGWIDGQVSRFDESFYLQRFTRRGPRSKWSQINREKAAALIKNGRMTPAGLVHVETAQRDGRWEDAYAPQSRATIPPDFQRALDRNPKAKEFFATLKGSSRYAFLYRLHHTKKPDSRARRIEQYIALLGQRKTL